MRSRNRNHIFGIAAFSVLTVAATAFGLQRSFADSVPFEITDVVISQKSDTATGDISGYEGNRVNNNIVFHKVGDSVTYRIVIKNISGGPRVIDNIASSYQGELFTYEFNSYAGDVVEADESFDFVLKTTYTNAVSDVTKRNQSLEIKFVFKFSDGSDMTIVIANPSTWDNISVFGVVMAASVIGLLSLIIFRMKHVENGKKIAMSVVLLAVACVPLPLVNAADGVYDVTISNNYVLDDELIVRFMSEDGVDELSSATVSYDELAESVVAPAKEGYYFTGWKTEEDETFAFDTPITEDITLHASYAPYNYTVQFDGNGANGGTAMQAQTMTYDSPAQLARNTYTRAGYNFLGWSTSASATEATYRNEQGVENLRNTSGVYQLYAVWQARKDTRYTLVRSFMTVDGEGYISIGEISMYGTTDTYATPIPSEFDGFKTPAAEDVLITGDGMARIEHKYDRIQYHLAVSDEEFVGGEKLSGDYNYETEITLTAKDRFEYDFVKWSNDSTDKTIKLTITGDTEIKPIYKEFDFRTIFSHAGACTFHGDKTDPEYKRADNITGDDCEDYQEAKFINTGAQLFNDDNFHKDFLISVTIDDFNPGNNPYRGTLINGTLEVERLKWPGIVLRRNDRTNNFLIGSNIVNYGNASLSTYVRPSSFKKSVEASSVKTFKFMRKNDNICYQINDEAPQYMNTQGKDEKWPYKHDTPVYFGASFRAEEDIVTNYFNGTLSNMTIKLGKDTDNVLNCEKP